MRIRGGRENGFFWLMLEGDSDTITVEQEASSRETKQVELVWEA